jgi:hypothetical protein
MRAQMFKTTFCIGLLAATFGGAPAEATVLAGGVSDGGGSAIVCRDSAKNITSAELLDLWEARLIYGLSVNVDDPSLDHIGLAQKVARTLDEGGGLGDRTGLTTTTDSTGAIVDRRVTLVGGDVYSSTIQYTTDYATKIMRLLPPGTILKLVEDYTSPIIPRDCAVEQLALFQDAANRLLVVEEIWSKLDKVNKAALLIHEALYSVLRSSGEQNSDRSRRAVGLAFSGQQFPWVFGNLPQDFLLCSSMEPTPRFRMAIFESNGLATYQFFHVEGKLQLSETIISTDISISPLVAPSHARHASLSIPFHNAPMLEGNAFTVSIVPALDGKTFTTYVSLYRGPVGSVRSELKCHASTRPEWRRWYR